MRSEFSSDSSLLPKMHCEFSSDSSFFPKIRCEFVSKHSLCLCLATSLESWTPKAGVFWLCSWNKLKFTLVAYWIITTCRVSCLRSQKFRSLRFKKRCVSCHFYPTNQLICKHSKLCHTVTIIIGYQKIFGVYMTARLKPLHVCDELCLTCCRTPALFKMGFQVFAGKVFCLSVLPLFPKRTQSSIVPVSWSKAEFKRVKLANYTYSTQDERNLVFVVCYNSLLISDRYM